MFHFKFVSPAALLVCLVVFSACPAEQKSPAAQSSGKANAGLQVDESDWAVFMDAPAYHFALAREYLQKGDKSKAAAELKRGNTFLNFEKNRISFAEKQIEALSNGISSGKEKDLAKLDAETSTALNIVNRKYAMIPVEIDATSVFEDAYRYHFDMAKSKLQENDRAGSASELRRVAAFLRLNGAYMGHVANTEMDSAENALKEMASKVESGTVKDVKELEQAFEKAVSVVSRKR
jgi:hypothetical protein